MLNHVKCINTLHVRNIVLIVKYASKYSDYKVISGYDTRVYCCWQLLTELSPVTCFVLSRQYRI